jgi:hypothetical protein
LKPKCPVREFQITQSKHPNVPSLGGKKKGSKFVQTNVVTRMNDMKAAAKAI